MANPAEIADADARGAGRADDDDQPTTVAGHDHPRKGRLELRRGQCELPASSPPSPQRPLRVQTEAAASCARSTVEEHNQRVLAANRSFDAGMAAYRSKDTFQAMAIFRQVTPACWPPTKRGQLREVMGGSPADRIAAAAAPDRSVAAGTPAMPSGARPGHAGWMIVPENRGAMPATPTTQGGETLPAGDRGSRRSRCSASVKRA